MTEPYPRKGRPHATTDPDAEHMVRHREAALKTARTQVAQAEKALSFALNVLNNPYVCRCCGVTNLAPLGMYDHNQCGICWNGIHGQATCKHPKGHLDHD